MLKWVQFLSIDQINFYICNSGLNISPRHLAILCQKVGLYAVLWSILILYDCNFISSMHCPLDVFNHFHQVENHIVGAPCGVMDQMASSCGEANKLLAMICQVCIVTSYQKQYFPALMTLWCYCSLLMQPAEIVGLVDIPSHIRFWGIDSGIRHRLVVYHYLQ